MSAATARAPEAAAARCAISPPAPVDTAATAPDEALAERADLCRFLAACFYQPDPAFAEERLFDAMHEAAQRVDPALGELAAGLGADFAAQDLQTLLVDYTRLFLGPAQPLARPYGSCWLGGGRRLMHDSTLAAVELYREGGLALDDTWRELPDHVAAELEFVYLLLLRQHPGAGDADARAAAAALERRFLHQHLGAWIGPFAAAVADGAQTAFYRRLAALTERFVRREAQGGAG